MKNSIHQHSVTIAITRYGEPDAIIAQSIRHALAQKGVRGELLYIEQDEASTLANTFDRGHLSLRVIRGRLAGLSEARNVALETAQNPLVLFLDADALAEPDWAQALVNALSDPRCAIAGARVQPGWPGKAPYFSRARVLRDQYSLLDLGDGNREYHRVVGAGFGVDTAKLPNLRFDPTLGRRNGLLFGGEETDFCNRARALGFDILYVGAARITHLISPERCRLRWILKRMFFAGHGRARLGGAPHASGRAGMHDWLLMPLYLPFYAMGWLWGKIDSGRA